jgi:hypothetical protein
VQPIIAVLSHAENGAGTHKLLTHVQRFATRARVFSFAELKFVNQPVDGVVA